MNVPEMKRCALACAALLGGAACLAGETVLDEASSEPVGLNNLEAKVADANEILTLPAAWGDTNAPTLTIVGESVTTNGTHYSWDTGPLMPDEGYLVSIAYGNTSYTSRFTVVALAAAEWGWLDVDNVTPRVAKATENLTLPAAWGEDAADLALVWTDALGDHEKALDATATSYAWSTLPLMPGAYGVKLTYGGKETDVASYTVAALGEGVAENDAFLDNAYDADPAGAGVRDIANHTNEFNLSWQGVASAELTLDGEYVVSTEQENMSWFWETNGLTYALYTFTNKVDGSNYVARFRVNADKIAVMFHEDTNDVLVAKNWEHLPTAANDASRKALSDLLKTPGSNGYALWKSYVLGISPSTALNLKSNIAVTNLPPDQIEVTVWPMQKLEVTAGSQATVEYGIERTEGLEGTPAWTRVKNLVTEGDMKYVETVTNKVKRFYRTKLDVQPTPKTNNQ